MQIFQNKTFYFNDIFSIYFLSLQVFMNEVIKDYY